MKISHHVHSIHKLAPVCAAILVALAGIEAQAAPPADHDFVKGRVLVAPKPGLPEHEFDKILNEKNGRTVGRVGALDVHIVQVPENAEKAVAQALSRNPHIKFAELDSILKPDQIVPNDPNYPAAWHLPKINAPAAWDVTAGSGVIVAVLDTGVDGTHPDLASHLVPGWNSASNNSDTSDIYGHGTQTAGTVGALTNNTAGVASVAWNTQLMPVRISNDSAGGNATASAISSGLTWAADHGASVANISYAVAGSSTVSYGAQYFRSRGGVVVVAAGNTGTDLGYSDNPNMIAVSATTSTDQKASWSSYGAYVDVAAPGAGIWTTTRGGGYAAVSGTSFASPVTAGVVALIRAANPNLTPAEVETVLEKSAFDPVAGSDWYSYFGWGRVDASAAVQLALSSVAQDTQPPTTTIFNPPAGSIVKGLATVEVSASDNVNVTQVELYAGSTRIGTDTAAPFSFSWDTSLVANGNVTLTAKAFDDAQNVGSSAGVSVAVDNVPNNVDTTPPLVTVSNPVNGSVVGNKVNVSARAQDNVAVTQMKLYIDGKQVTSTTSGSLAYTWNTRNISKGGHTIQALAFDMAGNQNQASVQVTK